MKFHIFGSLYDKLAKSKFIFYSFPNILHKILTKSAANVILYVLVIVKSKSTYYRIN